MHKKQSKQHKHKKSRIPRDHAAVALNSLTPIITNDNDYRPPEEEVRHSHDEAKADQSDRMTDTMGEWHKDYEDNFY